MKAIILAGGQGTRLKPLISDMPKPMALINGKPFLEYLVQQLKKWGIHDIILSVGYKKEKISSYFLFGAEWGVDIHYVQENVPLGTGGAIREALESVDDTNVLVLNGDSFFDADINSLVAFHNSKDAVVTLALKGMADTGRYGRVEINEDGDVISFHEKRGSQKGLINTGMYVVNRKILPCLLAGKHSFENDVLTGLSKKGAFGLVQEGYFIDIGIPDDYATLCNNHRVLPTGEPARQSQRE